MEEIWNKMNLLVKGNQKISLNIISLLLKTISEYNIIDISNE
ncbi:adrenodoxin reductase [Hallella multisaccharivorax DSM 17128]|uniref:Adrenodoxin reductase n=1 Tax=Hallella multisaccharivorax DSM 17128 TaxID=688246 RepID=F8NBB2_9BACT|nr:adrenodoxin reductase [Hallella multisaccharivorax DSM 17128]